MGEQITERRPPNGWEAVAASLEAAFRDQDVGRVYHDDIRVWHNNDRVTQTREQNLAGLDFFFNTLNSKGYGRPYYANIELAATDHGFVQQHVIVSEGPAGVFELPACLVVRLENGKIIRLDEYLDASAFLSLLG